MDGAFDLNVEKILEHWTPAHALREVIANALDEHALVGDPSTPAIERDADGTWHVRDRGRGLRYQHLTQNESDEKKDHPGVVGQFGVGLKDALATFFRNGIGVEISSPHGHIRLDRRQKHGFADVETLHAMVGPPAVGAAGTDVGLSGISDDDVITAMRFFLRFDPTVTVVESTPFGSVLRREGDGPAAVYVRGVRVAEDEGLLFSYDITKLDTKLRKALNRERANVGRSAYTDRVKAILLAVESNDALTALAHDMAGFESGSTHDEVGWTDVAEQVVVRLAALDPTTVFVTAKERWSHAELIRRAEAEGRQVFVVPDALAARLARSGNDAVMTLDRFVRDWNDRVVIEPLDPEVLDPDEAAVLALADPVVRVAAPGRRVDVVVSETLHLTPDGRETADGLWEPAHRRIVVNRSCLRSQHRFVATLLHELAHAMTGAIDLSPEFEDGLTELLGTTGLAAVEPARQS